jgi:hypothetical protein
MLYRQVSPEEKGAAAVLPVQERGDPRGRKKMSLFFHWFQQNDSRRTKRLLTMEITVLVCVSRTSNMPNTYKRKTNHASWTQEILQSADETFLEKIQSQEEVG